MLCAFNNMRVEDLAITTERCEITHGIEHICELMTWKLATPGEV